MSGFRWTVVLLTTLGLTTWAGLTAVESQFPPLADFADAAGYNEIEPGLFMGGLVDEPPKGVECVLNLCDFKDSYRAKHHYWNAIPDSEPAPSLDWLKEQVAIVDRHRKKDHGVYIHCLAGISRSGMVTVAYLMSKNNWTRDEALAFVRKSRPIADPNPAFMDRLLEWEKRKK